MDIRLRAIRKFSMLVKIMMKFLNYLRIRLWNYIYFPSVFHIISQDVKGETSVSLFAVCRKRGNIEQTSAKNYAQKYFNIKKDFMLPWLQNNGKNNKEFIVILFIACL